MVKIWQIVKGQHLNVILTLRKVRPRYCFTPSSGIIFQDALECVVNRLIHATLSALSIISKSSILSPLCFFSLMMVLTLTFAGLPSQIKLKDILLISFTKCFGIESTDALYISFDKPKVLTIFILLRRVSFLRIADRYRTSKSKPL